ncbi:EAL domain-containing protein [Vibrio owensii]|uniref:EAL domain-containing protein n=1 Tax=Vibrio harveyi group TaxID=717610 RepID=UPI003CC621F3
MNYENLKFRRFLQPVYELSSNTISHYEMLIRLLNGKTAFPVICELEKQNMIHLLDLDNLEFALSQFDKNGLPKPVAINISAKSASNAKFCIQALELLENYPQFSNMITFEITETAKIENLDTAKAFLDKARSLGVKVSADDFGSGYMSEEMLVKLPYDNIKLDKCLIETIFSEESQTRIESLMNSYKDREVTFTAEFIEDNQTLSKVREMGIEFGQGYYLAKPIPIELARENDLTP